MSYANRARVQHLLDLDRAEEARDLARTYIIDDPQDTTMISMLADAEYRTDGPEVALATIERALAIDHDDSTCHAQHGYFLSNLRRHDDADNSFNAALNCNPTNSYALSAHVEAILRDPRSNRRRTKETRLALAYSRVQVLLATYPQAAISHLMDGKIHLARGQYAQCDAAARRALAIEPNNPIGHQLIGLAAESMGNTRVAGDAYVQAQKADPTSSTGIEGLRRLGKGAAIPVGFGIFLALRLGVRVGKYMSGVLAGAFVVLLVGAAIAFLIAQSKKQDREAKEKLSPQARNVLDQDEKFG